MKTHTTALLAMILALPVTVHAQSSVRAEASASTTLEASGPSGSRGSAAGSAALAANAAAGLPEAHIQRTISEGEAKGASRAQIDRAAMSAHTRLRAAKEVLAEGSRKGSGATEAEVTAAAEAFAAGASRADVARVREASPSNRDLAFSLQALARLRAEGMAGRNAAREIAAKLRSGASDGEIAALAEGAGGFGQGAGSVGGAAGAIEAGADAGARVRGLSGSLNGAASVTGALGGGIF